MNDLVFVSVDTVPLGIVGLHPELSEQMYQLRSFQFSGLVGISLLEESVSSLLGHIESLHHGLELLNIDSTITIIIQDIVVGVGEEGDQRSFSTSFSFSLGLSKDSVSLNPVLSLPH